MIPTMIVAGVLIGFFPWRWWLLLPVALSWPVLLVDAGIDLEPATAVAAVLLALANATTGLLVSYGLVSLVQAFRASLRAEDGQADA